MGREPEKSQEEREFDELGDAVMWIQERGGPGQVAKDFLKMTAGEISYDALLPALEKAGAPVGVYSLINRELWVRRKRDLVDQG